MRNLLAALIAIFLLASAYGEEQQLTDVAIHNGIVRAMDSENYKEAVRLLEQMKTSFSGRYSQFPYSLLYAKMLNLEGESDRAFNAYQEVYKQQSLKRFALLPLARIAASREKTDLAIAYYKEYLQNLSNPDYREVAIEALDYCVIKGKAAELGDIAVLVERGGFERTSQYYLARSYRMEKKDQLARTLLLTLIRKGVRDDVTSLALAELDSIDGKTLTKDERAERGLLAVDVWNYRLAREYLEPIASERPQYSYYYARSLYFLGDLEGSKKAYQNTLTLWPNDSIIKLAISQYANVCLHSADYQKALELLRRLPSSEENTFKQVQALRALTRFSEAISLLNRYASARNRRTRSLSRFLRGRIFFQTGRYRDALSDFTDVTSPRSSVSLQEGLLWKAHTLEKLGRREDALSIYRRMANGTDFFALKAMEGLGSVPRPRGSYTIQYSLCRLPDNSALEEVRNRINSGDVFPGLLFLHLYEEASDLLPTVSAETWRLLGINPNDRLQRFLSIAQLATLGQDYATATYYSELFLHGLPKSIPALSLPKELLQVLFPLPYKEAILKFSKERSVDPLLVMSIMKQESKFKRYARSQAFARGLMQLIPETAGKIALALGLSNFTQDQLYLPDIAINIGTKYIQDMMKEFGQQVEILAAGYNGGESNLRRWLAASSSRETLDFFSNIDMSETKKYVMIVKTNYEVYKRIYGSL